MGEGKASRLDLELRGGGEEVGEERPVPTACGSRAGFWSLS